jgi:hypothetical protein
MGIGSYVAGVALNAAEKQTEMKQRLKGRTPDQQQVIKYFYGKGKMSDQEYDGMVMAKMKGIDFKRKALEKHGLDESQVNEVSPIHFEDYFFNNDGKNYAKRGKDGVLRSSAYQVTWLLFSSSQVYIYQYTFNMDEDGRKEQTEEYFYKDITNFSSITDSVEKDMPAKTSCTGKVTYVRSTVDTHRFAATVPGDKFYCAMKQNDYTEKAIQGMKAKLREKKES